LGIFCEHETFDNINNLWFNNAINLNGLNPVTFAVRFNALWQVALPPLQRSRSEKWGGQRDLNPRQPDPQSGALTGLSYDHQPEPESVNFCPPPVKAVQMLD
jgi:hypothetical protein